MNIMPDYDEFTAELSAINASINAAECHGFLCAHICVGKSPSWQVLQDYLLADIAAYGGVENGLSVLSRLVNRIVEDITDDTLSFTLLMPAADTFITERTIALTEWCSGFINGLGIAGISDNKSFGDEYNELLKDIIAISRMETHTEESEAAERDFFELVEYIRIGVMMLFQECRHMDNVEYPGALH